MENKDWGHQPLTWALLRTHFGAWFSRHKTALSIALAVAVVVWGICRGIAQTGNPALPSDAKLVQLTDYAQAYDVFKQGATLILRRVRTEGDINIAGASFGIVWWIVYLLQEYRSERSLKTFSRSSFLIMNGVFGILLAFLIYADVYPSVVVLTEPQVITLDPVHDLVTMNDLPLGRLSSVAEFEGVEKHEYRSDWSWFGVKLKDGRYYVFTKGQLVGGNVTIIAGYLNQYLRQSQLPSRQ